MIQKLSLFCLYLLLFCPATWQAVAVSSRATIAFKLLKNLISVQRKKTSLRSISQWLHGTRAMWMVGSCIGSIRAGTGSQGPSHHPRQEQLGAPWHPAPGVECLPGDGHGLGLVQDVCPVGEGQEQAWWGESRSHTAPGLLGRAKGTAPSEPRHADQMRAAVCCDQGMTWAAGKVLGPRGTA